MAFCTGCGSRIADDARFCTSCGQLASAQAASPLPVPPPIPPPIAAPAPSAAPLQVRIQGDNLQVARVRLTPGQEVYAEAGRMVYKTAGVHWETRMSGETVGEKLLGALRRTVTGESLFLTWFRCDMGEGEVGFAGDYPGRIQAFELRPGQSVLAQREAFLFAQSTVELQVALVKKLGAGLFGGEGFILEKLTGPGSVFIHAGGDFIEFDLKTGETLQVETGSIVAFDESVAYDIQLVGGIKTALFGGEGLFLATMTGPGKVIVQSMTLEKMRRRLVTAHSGGDEQGALHGILGGR